MVKKDLREIVDLLKTVRTLSYHRKEVRQIEDRVHKIASSLQIKIDPESESGPTKNSLCPERFLGTLEGYPLYEHGFEPTDCANEKKLGDLVTVVFDFTDKIYDGNEQLMRRVLDAANANFKRIKIAAIATSSNRVSAVHYPNVNFISTTRKVLSYTF